MFSARAGASQVFGVDNSSIIDSAHQVCAALVWAYLIPYPFLVLTLPKMDLSLQQTLYS